MALVVGEVAGKTQQTQSYCEVLLAEPPVRRSFNFHLWQSFNHVPGETWDRWREYLEDLLTGEVLGARATTRRPPGRPRTR